ncbi:hypothetical protein ACFL15_01170 [Patescibacteria group bacterium]
MYPAQTSLIPVTVALVRYIKDTGFIGNYPYWYLGTTPVKYLIGPVIPSIEIFINKLFSINFFDISIYLVIVGTLLSCLGWSLFIYQITKDKKLSFLSFLFLLIFPWRIISSLILSETSFAISRNFIPFVLMSTYLFVKRKNILSFLIALFLHCFILLTHSGIIPILIVFEISLILSLSYKNKKFIKVTKYLKKVLILFISSFLLVTLWYGLDYWLTIFINPSLGGLSVFKVFLRIFELLRWFIPIYFAAVLTRLFQKDDNKLTLFVFLFVGFFGILTFYRFIADYDFWTDWTTWLFEIEIGVAIIVSSLFLKAKNNIFKTYAKLAFMLGISFLATFLLFQKIGKPKLVSDIHPEYMSSLEYIQNISKDDLVFLSGTSVFWVNSMFDIYQVRGGRDEVAVNPEWNTLSFDLRESNNVNTVTNWLSKYEIGYILVHSQESKEYYKDFKNQNMWPNLGTLILNENGDQIYKINTRILSE